MAQYDIIGGIVDPKALQELKDLEAIASKIGKSLKGVTLGGISSEADLALVKRLNAETDLLIKKTEQYNTTIQRGAKLTMEQKVAQQALNNEAKLNAIVTSQQTTALQKMYAQMKLLEIEMQSKFNPALKEQSAEFQALSQQHAKLQQEYARTSRATGVMGRQMNSMYGSTFQLTQVMRELPNFAISARVGFMSLSNNLPMLIDSFKILKQQIIDTEGAAGATRKTWAAFGKSLLSLNTIMIIASTLLVLFGDDIVDFATKLFKGEKSIDKTSASLKALIATTKDYTGQAAGTIKKIQELGLQVEKYGGETKYAQTLVENFNSTFNTHLTTIEQVKAAYPEMAKAAIDSAVKTQAAMSLIEKSSIAMLQGIEANQKLSGYKKETVSTQEKMLDRLFAQGKSKGIDLNKLTSNLIAGEDIISPGVLSSTIKDNTKEQNDLREFYSKPENLWFAKYIAQQRKANKTMKYLNEEAAKLIQPPTPNKSTSGDGTVQSGKDIYIEQKFYDEERIKLVKKLASVELGTQEEVTKGFKNTIAERRDATQKQYEYTEQLAKLDLRLELNTIKEKTSNDLIKLDKDKKYNDALYENNKISKERHLELENQYNVALSTIMRNAEIDTLNAQDIYYKKKHEAALKSAELMIAIQAQEYAQSSDRLDKGTKFSQDKLSVKQSSENSKLNKLSTSQLLGKAFGNTNDNSFAKLESERKFQSESIQIEINAEKMKLGAFKGTQEQREKSLEKIAELERKNANEGAEYQIKISEMVEQEKQDIQVQMLQQSFELMKTITDEFFKYQEKKIDEKLNKDTKINEEKLKQYEDETNAGIHSQKELSDYKERNIAYQESLEAEAARKKEELEKSKFLLDQALALGNVAMATALGAIVYGSNPITAPLVPWVIALGGIQAAIIAAQTIPAFKDGVDNFEGGKAILGDGYKHELVVSPKGMFISDNTPKLYDLDKNTTVFPDINKVNLNSLLALRQVGIGSTEKRDDRLMNELINAVKSKKQGNFYGMPLIRQMSMSDRYSSRKRGLMN